MAGGVAVTAGTFASHLLGYLLSLMAARRLGPADYGAVAALLGLLLVGFVPAMGLQTAAALHVARARSAAELAAVRARLLRSGLAIAAGVSGVGMAAAVPIAVFLHLPNAWPVVLVGLALLPLTLVGVFQGVLQGGERFHALAVMFAVAAVGKSGGGLAGVLGLVGPPSPTAVFVGTAVGSVLAAVFGWWLAGADRPAGRPEGVWHDVVHATHALLAMFLLANIDVILARHYLPAAMAGLYAVGAMIAKGAFWLPQAVGVMAFPRLADPLRRTATLPRAIALVAGLGGVTVAATALLGRLAVHLVGGEQYVGLASDAWRFALLGALLALAQLLLFSRLALADRRFGVALWLAVCAEVALIAGGLHGSPSAIVGAAGCCAAGLVLVGLLVEERGRRSAASLASAMAGQRSRQ
jgi:O-antigen/teichoic acid export membrane protein